MRKIVYIAVLVIAVVVIPGCSQFSLREIFEQNNHDTAYLLIPGNLTIQTGKSYTFTVQKGIPPYEFLVLSGTGTIDSVSGKYTAPDDPEVSTVAARDSRGDLATTSVTVTQAAVPLDILPAMSAVDPGDTVDFSVFGGIPPYNWNLEPGSIGSFSGATYTAPNNTSGSATVTVTDNDVPPVSKSAVINVIPPSALKISPDDVTVNVDSTMTFTGLGGYASDPSDYNYVLTGVGSLSATSGASTVYTADGGTGSATVTISDLAGGDAVASITIGSTAGLGISPANATVFTGGSIDFEAFGGSASYTFAKTAGVGGVDSATGVYTAPLTLPGDNADSAVIQVTDGVSPAATAAVTVIAPLTLSPPSATIPVLGTVGFSASGGTGGYTYQKVSGVGSIDGGGSYSSGNAGSATVRVTDSSGYEATAVVTVTLPAPLSISPAVASVLVGETVAFTGVGGTGGYTYQKAAGGGSIDSGGVYTAPLSPGYAAVRVSDGVSIADASINVVAKGPLTITPAAATVAVDNTAFFSASGGTPPYIYSIQSGVGSVNAFTGFYTAPSSTGSAQVKVTDSATPTSGTAVASVVVSGAQCGRSFDEVEPNEKLDEADDFGIVFAPGCSVTIFGDTEEDGHDDYFAFNTGTAKYLTIICSFPGGDNALDLKLKHSDGNDLYKAETNIPDSETMIWFVDTPDADRYLQLDVKEKNKNYVLTISGG